jgi:hypothetical protein
MRQNQVHTEIKTKIDLNTHTHSLSLDESVLVFKYLPPS